METGCKEAAAQIPLPRRRENMVGANMVGANMAFHGVTPGLHNKIPALKIFARGWVAQEPIFYTINAKILDGNLVMETGCYLRVF